MRYYWFQWHRKSEVTGHDIQDKRHERIPCASTLNTKGKLIEIIGFLGMSTPFFTGLYSGALVGAGDFPVLGYENDLVVFVLLQDIL